MCEVCPHPHGHTQGAGLPVTWTPPGCWALQSSALPGTRASSTWGPSSPVLGLQQAHSTDQPPPPHQVQALSGCPRCSGHRSHQQKCPQEENTEFDRSRWLGGLARCSPIPEASHNQLPLGGLGEVEGAAHPLRLRHPTHPPPQP